MNSRRSESTTGQCNGCSLGQHKRRKNSPSRIHVANVSEIFKRITSKGMCCVAPLSDSSTLAVVLGKWNTLKPFKPLIQSNSDKNQFTYQFENCTQSNPSSSCRKLQGILPDAGISLSKLCELAHMKKDKVHTVTHKCVAAQSSGSRKSCGKRYCPWQ